MPGFEASAPVALDAAVDAVLDRSVAAGATLAAVGRSARADLLDRIAAVLTAAGDALLPLAAEETRLAVPRLETELRRTAFQAAMFATLIRDPAAFEPVLDPADPDHPVAPKPDLRSIMQPIGPVLVYAASNFPFAFSVAGGDTISAVAAGCAVVVKVHEGHPRLSAAVADLLRAAAREQGLPEDVLQTVSTREEGIAALRDDRIRAASFTGSEAGGRALFDIAATRRRPIPFYGELGSVNPVFVLPTAAASRTTEIASGFAASYLQSGGQPCTKPGVLVVPVGSDAVSATAEAVAAIPPAPMLTPGIEDRFRRAVNELARAEAVTAVAVGVARPASDHADSGDGMAPSLFVVRAAQVLDDPTLVTEERFGPAAVIVEYGSREEMEAVAALFEGTLTATVHADPDDADDVERLLPVLRERAGRLIYNGFPTGVAVSPAMHHGGPYPSATSGAHTAVGAGALRRFLRPISFQGFPESLMPVELRTGSDGGPAESR